MDTGTAMTTTGGGGDHGPGHWDPIDACVGVQGPFGYVQGSACI